jgi:RHS repeat-associated protein
VADGRNNGPDHQAAAALAGASMCDQESFRYDPNGNRTALVQNGKGYLYEYGENNRLLKVFRQDSPEKPRQLLIEYTYDGNGNTIKRDIYGAEPASTSFEYDVLNRVTSSEHRTGPDEIKTTRYVYDNAGNRLLKITDDETVLYLRHGQIAVAMELVLPKNTVETKGSITRYALSGDLIAGELATTVAADASKTTSTRYYHLDHLNSTKLVSDEQGEISVEYVYRAFGEQLGKIGDGEARHTYGGKELDNETNLYYFNARYYDATTGRFISVDPAQDGINWYVYCNNNPLSFVDPTGLETEVNSLKSEDLQPRFLKYSIR